MDSDVPVARRILEALAAANVETVFGLPGVHNLAFWREAGEGLPAIVGVRHEQTAVYAADGLARASGGLGVALTTTGPGAANAAGAFGEAAASGSPVLLIASEISTRYAKPGVKRGVLHESRDQAAIFEPLAKAVFRPRTAEEVSAAVGEAIRAAMTSPRGPVYLDVPTDLLDAPAPAVRALALAPVEPPADQVEELAEAIGQAQRVVIWAGGGVVQADAGDALSRLARALAAPVVTTYTARGILPPEHECLVGLPPHEPEVARLIAEADLLLVVGSDLDGMMTRNWQMPVPDRIAIVNCAAEDLSKNYQPAVAVLGDARITLERLLDLLPDGARDLPDLAALRRTLHDRLGADGRNEEPLRFLATVNGVLAPDTPVVADMAIPGYWFGGYGAVSQPRRLQYPVGWGTLGYALPASIGAAVAQAGPVLAICGDGGIMFALGELATIAQERLPVTVLLVDDGGYGMLRFDQDHAGDPHRGVDLLAPDWAQLAQSFGIAAAVVQGVGEDLRRALQDAIGSKEPRLVVCQASMIPPRTTSPRWFE
ncbi:thiamine pyrophosphate-binding protein [Planosporangium thailandense]|uniref:Thiamine pyrophosphate-binding protein n=1 Tax=Planosporangium thailandense TaxID=765197 RepID=A0ABX0XZD7_9ACTN|nr:thiamine pyrophosphate-binding protein [Planosporangium thailandense]NJC71413.1 thiamine pyrophosphate-binding protein [Planosporangium thailandense]